MQDERTFRTIGRALGTAGLAAALAFGVAGCHQNSASAAGPDPANANMASANGQQPTQVMGENTSYSPQQQSESYPEGQQAPAPIVQGNPDQTYPGGYGPDDSAEQAGEEAIEQTNEAPPPLPEYEQPPCPGPDYIWTPGYWAWGPGGYYWVPGAWVEAPYYGALWTPPYWGWYGGYYRFHRGYWGPHVGYYGGIDYGFGYIGIGFFGGYWSGHNFYYNRDVSRLGGGIRNYYSRPVVYNNVRYGAQPSNRISYNGGRGGLNVRPNASEMAAERERHDPPMAAQRNLRTQASQNRGQFFVANHGRPTSVAEARGFANTRGIAAPPRGVEPGRTAVGAPNAAERGVPERGFNGARPGEAPGARMNPGEAPGARVNPGVRPGEAPGARVNPGERNAMPNRNVEPNRSAPQPGVGNRPAMQPRMENRPAPQPRVENRPAPQVQAPRMENRPAPQPRVENRPAPQMQAPRAENRPTPQQRMEAPRPAPQQRMQAPPRPAPQPRAQAPRPAPAPHPAGGGGGHPAPGGNDHDHH